MQLLTSPSVSVIPREGAMGSVSTLYPLIPFQESLDDVYGKRFISTIYNVTISSENIHVKTLC